MQKRGGGGTTRFGVVLTWELEFLVILNWRGGGGGQNCALYNGGGGGGGEGAQKVSNPPLSHFVAPLPIIDDRSLSVIHVSERIHVRMYPDINMLSFQQINCLLPLQFSPE